MRRFRVTVVCLMALVALAPTAAGQSMFNDFVTLGFQGGFQEHSPDWIGYFQLFSDLGPEHSAQLRMAVRSGLLNRLVPTTFLTNIILNIGTASQRFYIGAGIGVPINSIGTEGTSLQATALLGLRAPAVPGVIASIEGGLIAPFDFSERPLMYMTLGVSFPL